ncbi:MAG: hypothetical protein HY662_00285 [Chloroflexi bacterium]|nr:hypothetical protein [Chloroflexota bacterium]
MVTLVRKYRNNLYPKTGNRLAAKTVEAFSGIGELPCPVALDIARKLNIAPGIIGDKANRLKIRISKCQLGCFSVKKAMPESMESESLTGTLSKELRTSLPGQKLPCKEAFEIAGKLNTSRRQVGDAATRLKIRIVECQLGCFS